LLDRRAGSGGTNPEQLFAAGYSACFLSSMAFVVAHVLCPYSHATRGNLDVRLTLI